MSNKRQEKKEKAEGFALSLSLFLSCSQLSASLGSIDHAYRRGTKEGNEKNRPNETLVRLFPKGLLDKDKEHRNFQRITADEKEEKKKKN